MLDQIYHTVWCQVFSSSWTAHGGPDHTQQRLAARQEADLAAAAAVQEWDSSMQTAAITAKTKADNAAPRAPAPPAPTADDFTIDGEFVEFYADGEEAPCERFQLRIDEVGDDGVYFSLYCDGTLHDGFTTLDGVARAFPQVAVDLDDWKAGRLAPFAVVRSAAFAHAAVEDPSDDEDEDEDEEG